MFPVTRPTLIFGPDPKSFFKIFLFISIFLYYICMLSSVKKCKICSNYLFLYIPHNSIYNFQLLSRFLNRLAGKLSWCTMTDVNNVRSAKSDCFELISGFFISFFLLNFKICEYYFRYICDFIIFNCLYFSKWIINIVCVDFLRDLLNIASIDKRHVLNHRNIFTAKCLPQSPALYIINYANIEYCDFCKH